MLPIDFKPPFFITSFQIIIEAADDAPEQKDRPKSLHLQVSRVLAANYRSLETGSKADLAETLETFQKSSLYYGTDFPNCPTDVPTVCDKFLNHATGQDTVSKGVQTLLSNRRDDIWRVMKKDLLWTEAKDVWYLYLDPVWADFHGTPSSGGRPVPLVDAFPVTLWLYKKPDDEEGAEPSPVSNQSPPQADMYVIGSINSLISIQLNHFQLLFLLRAVEMISEITMFLAQDVHDILGEESSQDDGSVVLGITIPQVDLSLLMPSIHQSRDSIGGDYDSIVPESTSAYSAGNVLPKTGNSTWPKSNLGEESDTDGTLQSHSDNLLGEDQSEAGSPTSYSNPPSLIDDQSITTPSVPKVIQASTENLTPIPSTPSTPRSKAKPKHLPSPNSLHIRSKSPSGKKHSLSSSITNMMASLDYRNTTPTDEENVSIKSDGSSESDNYVFIGQAETVNRENVDAALFNIHAPSPVEVAMEMTEEALSVTSRSSSARQTPQPPSLDAISTQSGRLNASESIMIKPQRDGMVRTTQRDMR